MTAPTFTPEPWEVTPSRNCGCGAIHTKIKIYKNGLHIATIGQSSFDRTEQDAPANARLIAEAPAMYEALRILVTAIELEGESNHYDSVITNCVASAKAILARIDGEAR
jgi:hypothetical protein